MFLTEAYSYTFSPYRLNKNCNPGSQEGALPYQPNRIALLCLPLDQDLWNTFVERQRIWICMNLMERMSFLQPQAVEIMLAQDLISDR